MMRGNSVIRQFSNHAVSRSLCELRLAQQVAFLQGELADTVKVLAETEKELDGVACQLDCALGHLAAATNYIGGSFKIAHDLGVVVEVPGVLVDASEFLAEMGVSNA